MFPFDNILDYVSDEQCALVLGPEIMHFEGKPMNMFVRDKLSEQFRDSLTHYYANDGLFAFPAQDAWVKTDLAKSLKNECLRLPQTAGFDEDFLKNLARIPVHLIISTNPDTFLSDVFFKYGIKHRFSYFRKGDRPSDEVAIPTRDEPLIYNIAGCILEDESLVLDYEDLFSLIGSSFGASGMPHGLQTALSGIRRYIFLGFNFEKWHTQILLRILCGKTFQKKYAGPHQVSAETRTFLANQFNIDFWQPDQGDFMAKFLESAEKYVPADPAKAAKPTLRALSDKPLAAQEINIIREIRNGQMLRAIGLLLEFAKNTQFELDAVHISGWNARIFADQPKMDSRDYQTNLNQISDAAIQLARQIAAKK